MLLLPAQDYFRIRLILALLEGCGQYFGGGPAGARLDRFLTFFQVCAHLFVCLCVCVCLRAYVRAYFFRVCVLACMHLS